MDEAALLTDAFERIEQNVHSVLDGLDPDDLAARVNDAGNSIGWLVWHLTRVQDDHIADVAGLAQVWTAQGWAERFALPLPAADTGYGHTPAQVADVRADRQSLVGYFDAVHAQTKQYVAGLSGADLDRVVDTRWDPPVTLGVRLISVINDDTQHVGQAAFVRGLLE